MGAVCCCFGPPRNHIASRSNRSGHGPNCWNCTSCVFRNIGNYLVTGSTRSNNTTIETNKHEREPKKECIVKLNSENITENKDENISSSSDEEEKEKRMDRLKHIFSSWEDEDVCPTCFEDYTLENPKITAHCSHHYHLGCIYDWMERSKNCPMCGKLMNFDGMQ
ncbi:E3 ubiquitin-protein ligase At3g02290-like [Impatiens glandulifera]|uniref:E3 ubiquitin-protein ligase At3g02290-like n=1 Tax=Impatiens glandulifera TaxID=253017 RepID=UPI001FB1861D|nr:E3 ubiquitin-protein ligase At3g02290-like [Impatiens glandulifera]